MAELNKWGKHINDLNNKKKELNEMMKNVEKIFWIIENGSINIKFRYQDEFIQTIDFIKNNKCDIIGANC